MIFRYECAIELRRPAAIVVFMASVGANVVTASVRKSILCLTNQKVNFAHPETKFGDAGQLRSSCESADQFPRGTGNVELLACKGRTLCMTGLDTK